MKPTLAGGVALAVVSALAPSSAAAQSSTPSSFVWKEQRTMSTAVAPFRLKSDNQQFHIAWQPDGNLVVYRKGSFFYQPSRFPTAGPNRKLRLMADGRLQIRNAANGILWTSVVRARGRDICSGRFKHLTINGAGTLNVWCGGTASNRGGAISVWAVGVRIDENYA